MRIAIVAGVVVEHDAISAAVAAQAALLADLPGVDDVTVFAQHLDRPLPCTAHLTHQSWSLLSHPEFIAADVAIFHWGIHYGLFDAITVLANSHPRPVIHFHNCTPADLVPPDQQSLIERSTAQIAHAISLGVECWTFSEFNRRTLLEWGADTEQVRFVPFPVVVGRSAEVRSTERLSISCIGRLVPSKGVHVLLEALAALSASERDRCRVRIAGSSRFSDRAYIDRLDALVDDHELRDTVEFVDAPSDDELWSLYATTDVVVSPSFHEGLCVPIIEGYSFGCRAVGTTAGNLPFIVVPDDRVVTPGVASELTEALREQLALGPVSGSSSSRRAVADRYSVAAASAAHRDALLVAGR